jgi:hypothetical protein
MTDFSFAKLNLISLAYINQFIKHSLRGLLDSYILFEIWRGKADQ